MRRKTLKITRFLALAALAAGTGICGLSAQELTKEESSRLKIYEAQISSANPEGAAKFLADSELLDKLIISDPRKAADLQSKAGAVTEYEKLLGKNWTAAQERNLSEAIASRLLDQSPLAKVGLAPEPEKTLDWAAKYEKYDAGKTALLKKSLRNWDALFNGYTFSPLYRHGSLAAWEVKNSTGNFLMNIVKSDAIFKGSEADMKALWETMTLKERNNYMTLKAGQALDRFVGSSTRSDPAFVSSIGNSEILGYLDGPGNGRLQKYIAQMNAVELTKSRLKPAQLAKLQDQPIEQQIYLLGNAFDKSEIKGPVAAERKIDSLRQSKPGETISPQNNELLAKMLGPSMLAEIKGNVAGDKVAKFYASGARLDISIESCQGCYAKYDPSSRKMIFDSELIQQYMRVNNITADSMVSSKEQLAGLSKYLSPMLVHEGTHQMQHAWAEKARVYKPYVAEDEEEAGSMEALYTMGKLKNDPKFKSMMLKMRASSSSYADKRLELERTFRKNTDEFGDKVNQDYYPGLPSFSAASSQILSAISGELERRNALAPAELAGIENSGKSLDEAKAMTTQELAGSVGGIKTAVLKKIQDDLLHKSLYEDHYQNGSEWTGSMRQVVKTTAAAPKSKVPAL
ncbi:MAG: hypothetical protein NTX59_04900 [Elusimicrobia bacterium]|nr:hypothetical protein [Elusimicrobiota bacterium]